MSTNSGIQSSQTLPRKTRVFRTQGDIGFEMVTVVILSIVSVVAIYPIYYVVIASISNPTYISSGQVVFFPRGLNNLAYEALFQNVLIWTGYKNSLFYTITGTLFNLTVVLPCSYSLSRENLPGKKILFFFFILTMYFSGGLVPTYLLMSKLGLINTIWIMILPTNGIGVFNFLISRTYFKDNIPETVFESARMDGASISRFFFSFVLPLSKPIIAVLALFYALGRWNAYFAPMIYIQDNSLQTLQVIIRSITANLDAGMVESMNPDEVSQILQQKQLLKYAVVVVSIIPMLLLYPFIQKYFVSGIMLGAVKE